MEHLPVLSREVQEYLGLKGGEVVADLTLGLGGHAMDSLKAIGEKGTLIGFDQDERNLQEAKKRLGNAKNTIFFHDNFCHLKSRLTGSEIEGVDAVLLDLGLSSPHVDEAERGFSFIKDGPLDMRFDLRTKLTAADVVNAYAEGDLSRIFFKYGEEKLGNKFARMIVERRKTKAFVTTKDLADFLEGLVPKKYRGKSHPATQVFQALRIEVNNELGVLEDVLRQVAEVLNVGGRVVLISYHSLEDRIVKQFFKDLERPAARGDEAIYSNFGEAIFESLIKKPVGPSNEELQMNPRSRSAKLRAYKKIKTLPLNFFENVGSH